MDIIENAREALYEREYKVVFTESTDERILKAARRLLDEKTCSPILLGNPEDIVKAADDFNVSLEGIRVYNMYNEDKIEDMVVKYHELVPMYSEKVLRRKAKKALNYAAMLVKIGYADCFASGVVNPTGDVILAAQQFIGLKENISLVSSIGFQISPYFDGKDGEHLIGVADCAVCAEPTETELADIAITSAEMYQSVMNEEALVAMVSYSTLGSGNSPSIEKVKKALEIVKEKRPDLKVEGEFQIDTALVPKIAERKMKKPSEVAGKANVLVFPDLNSGNIAVKCMQMYGNKGAYGPILQGFEKPVTDFSRAATVEDVVGNVTICLMQLVH